jgi:hypothetical protein
MQMIKRSMVALGFIGTIAGATATPAVAQGVYFEGPGFGVGVGRPAYRERYYRGYSDYDGPYMNSSRRYYRAPEVYERRSHRWRDRNWD